MQAGATRETILSGRLPALAVLSTLAKTGTPIVAGSASR
jgi:hypothetical protein